MKKKLFFGLVLFILSVSVFAETANKFEPVSKEKIIEQINRYDLLCEQLNYYFYNNLHNMSANDISTNVQSLMYEDNSDWGGKQAKIEQANIDSLTGMLNLSIKIIDLYEKNKIFIVANSKGIEIDKDRLNYYTIMYNKADIIVNKNLGGGDIYR